MGRDLDRLLREWRLAEQSWERMAPDDPASEAARGDVIRGWRAYNAAAGTFGEDELILLADDGMRCVAAFGAVTELLMYDPDALVGLPIAHLVPQDTLSQVDASWKLLLASGRLEGEHPLRAADGRIVMTRFRARAHHPLPGIHLSRHRVPS